MAIWPVGNLVLRYLPQGAVPHAASPAGAWDDPPWSSAGSPAKDEEAMIAMPTSSAVRNIPARNPVIDDRKHRPDE